MKLISGYSDYSADDLVHLGTKVAANLILLSIFSSLTPSAADISNAVALVIAAMAMIGPGRKQALENAFATLAHLLALVAVNAPQVKNVTDTELAQIGLPVVEAPTKTTEAPGVCENVHLRHGEFPGEVDGTCKRPGPNIRLYEVQWTLDPNGDQWTDAEDCPNSRSIHLTGLPRGKDIWVRVRARNTVGAGPWSDPATIMVT